MKLLLDTNALIRWYFGTIRATAVNDIRRADVVAVSAVSAWEIAIKSARGKLEFRDTVEAVSAANGFLQIPVTVRHADALRSLPLHHGDPFDRLIITQAIEEGMTIMTSDRAFEPYRVPVVWI